MGGYLEEKRSPEGHIQLWQTPNRQRWWGLVAAIIPSVFLIWSLTREQVNPLNVTVGCLALMGAFLVATWTQRFVLNTRYGIYEYTKGFLPFLFGDKGRCQEAFECVCLRKESPIDAAKKDDDPSEMTFDQYRLFLVWKSARRENILINTFPLVTERSEDDIHAVAENEGETLAKALRLQFMDQTIAYAAIHVTEDEEESKQAKNNPENSTF